MEFEIPTGLIHVYRYNPDGSDLPDPIGKANAIAGGLLYNQRQLDCLFLSSRPMKNGRLSLSEVTANQIRQDFPHISSDKIIVENKAATTYGEVRDISRYLAQNGNPSFKLIDVAAQAHIRHIKPFYDHFFPGQEVQYFSFEEVLRQSPIRSHREFLAEVEASEAYQRFCQYMDSSGLIYWMSAHFPLFNEFIELGPVAHLKHRLQWELIDQRVAR